MNNKFVFKEIACNLLFNVRDDEKLQKYIDLFFNEESLKFAVERKLLIEEDIVMKSSDFHATMLQLKRVGIEDFRYFKKARVLKNGIRNGYTYYKKVYKLNPARILREKLDDEKHFENEQDLIDLHKYQMGECL